MICKETINYGLNYGKCRKVEDLVRFSDSDDDDDKFGGKSTIGMIFYLRRNAVTWQSQKKITNALSTCDVEFMAATTAACQAIWIGNLTKELTGHYVMPITLFVDNKLDDLVYEESCISC